MSNIWLNYIKVKGYRSFGVEEEFFFPDNSYLKPVAIVGYNNSGKTNLINAIRYGIGDKFVNTNTFEIKDQHNLHLDNNIQICTRITASLYDTTDYKNQPVQKTIGGEYTIETTTEDYEIKSSCKPSFFGANKHYNIFYINFHKIKDEISTKKTSWGNLTSFLAKHVRKLVEKDENMIARKQTFKEETRDATQKILENTKLQNFIRSIKENYSKNLRDNNCEVQFVFPDYEDVFLQMVFKVGLHGNKENLIPVDHFGDGYISMFVMAIIQAIAETETDDKCLFLFEEPESFLHENHQEYFYKMVLCQLAEKGHQVIYTTHSDRMIDIFDTRGIIRLEYDENEKRTRKAYNNINNFDPIAEVEGEPLNLHNFNQYIKSVEPNLNRILFSKKIVLVEGPNDLMCYRYAIEKTLLDFGTEDNYARSFLNFLNISIVAHHGKITALLLTKICKHFGLDYFIINDWDLDIECIQDIQDIESISELKNSNCYNYYDGRESSSAEKGVLNVNWQLLEAAKDSQIHFNVKKLESVIGYNSDDKSSVDIWNHIISLDEFPKEFFPEELINFLEIPSKGAGTEEVEKSASTDSEAFSWDGDVFSSSRIKDDDLPF